MADANIRAVITADDRASGTLKRFESRIGGLGAAVATAAKAAGVAAIAAAAAGTVLGVKTAASLETARSAFIGLLGSAEEADKTLSRIKQEAKSTPFEMTGLTEGVKQLSAVTKTGDEAIDILLSVGKAVTASGGGQEELDRVVFNLKQIKGIGKLDAIDLKELRRAIPIFDKLVAAAGTTIEEIQKAKDPSAALFKVFEDGGKKIEAVDNAFTNQAGNFNQLVSNMKDSLSIFFADLVVKSGAFDFLKKGIDAFTNALSGNNQTIKNLMATLNNFWNNSLKPFLASVIQLAQTVWTFLKPSLTALWNTIKAQLMPALKSLYEKVIKPLAPFIGAVLVLAIWTFINALNFVIKVVSKVISKFSEWVDRIIGVGRFFVDLFFKIMSVNSRIYHAIVDPFQRAFDWIEARFNSIKNVITSFSPSNIAKSIGSKITGALGFASGGFTGQGGTNQIAGVVHKGEYVIPKSQVDQRTGTPRIGSSINLSVNVGTYVGSPMEKRRLASELFKAFQDVAIQNGVQPSALLDGTNGAMIR